MRRRASSGQWDSSGGVETADSYEFISSSDMINNCIEDDTQEWTNEDMAETTETIQILEGIVKAQFSISDDVECSSTFCVPADGIISPSQHLYRDSSVNSVNIAQSSRQQCTHAVDDYEPFEGKDSIFDDLASSGRQSRVSLSRESSTDHSYMIYDSRPPKSPASRKDDLDPFETQYIKSRGKGIIDPHLSDTVERASSKLRKFQRKIIRTIENSPEVREMSHDNNFLDQCYAADILTPVTLTTPATRNPNRISLLIALSCFLFYHFFPFECRR
jgi:hypothetical protein